MCKVTYLDEEKDCLKQGCPSLLRNSKLSKINKNVIIYKENIGMQSLILTLAGQIKQQRYYYYIDNISHDIFPS